jgi:hypothetical protein
MTIDTQHRGKTGEIRRKHGNTLIRTLRKTYLLRWTNRR